MTAPPPRRPWWKWKRTWAALALWLLLAPLVSAFAFLVWSENRPAVPSSVAARLRVGMTAAEVRGLLGAPQHVLPRRDGSRQWVFAGRTPSRHYVEFGSDGRVSGHWDDR